MEATTAHIIGPTGSPVAVTVTAVDRFGVSTVVMPNGTEARLNPGHVHSTAEAAAAALAAHKATIAMCEAHRGGPFVSRRAFQGD